MKVFKDRYIVLISWQGGGLRKPGLHAEATIVTGKPGSS